MSGAGLLWSAAEAVNAQSEGGTQGGGHLGMYTSSGTLDQSGFGGMGGGYGTRSSGVGVTDTVGVLAPGTKASVQDANGNGGIFGVYDATRFLPTNQGLLFSGFFSYAKNNITVGPIAGLSSASAGSAQSDTYTFGGSVLYRINTTYLQGTAVYDFGRGSETQNVDGSTGSFASSGYFVDARLGNIFVLFNTTGAPTSPVALPTKAPPKPTGGTLVGLDVSGHIGYSDSWVDGFTDSSGFVFGTDQTRFGDIGGRVKLFAAIPNNGLLWMPYVAGTVDQLFGFSSTLNIPSQVALAGGDLISLQEAKTFAGAQLGLDVQGRGWTVGIKGFYTASADTNIIGGNAYVKIPLNYAPLATPRY
jgi:hypothetical protein